MTLDTSPYAYLHGYIFFGEISMHVFCPFLIGFFLTVKFSKSFVYSGYKPFPLSVTRSLDILGVGVILLCSLVIRHQGNTLFTIRFKRKPSNTQQNFSW